MRKTLLLGAVISAVTIVAATPSPARAETCLLDTDGSGTPTAQDTTAGATDNTGDVSTLACGRNSGADAFGATALGAGANARGANASAIGYNSYAEMGSVALGANAATNDTNAVAVGGKSTAGGQGSTALGDWASSGGYRSVALGGGARATATGAIAIGRDSLADVAETVSVGNATLKRKIVNVADGVAAGDAATVGQVAAATQFVSMLDSSGYGAASATGTNSLALGAGSVADADNTVSVGRAAIADDPETTAIDESRTELTRRITNVADGQAPQDAATVGQLAALSGTVASFEGQVNDLFDLAAVDRKDTRRGLAAVAAMADPHFPSEVGKTSYASNIATHRGEFGISAGLMHRIKGNFAITAGATYAGGDSATFRGGVAGEF